jgi:carbamoyltransferase
MNILGINAAYHESAAALLVDGELVSFVEEERINRIKHAKDALIDNPHVLPAGAIKECLRQAHLDFSQIDRFAFSFSEKGRLQNKGADEFFVPGSWGTDEGEDLFHSRLMSVPEKLSELAGFDVSDRFLWVDHHLAHAASAFLCSPFEEALIIVADGIGEFDAISAFVGRHNQLGKIYSLSYPHSPGFLWEKICKFLGFGEHDACKLMGLASYGNPENYTEAFSKLAAYDEKEIFKVDNSIARFRNNDFSALEELFGPARKPDEFIEIRHKDIAATLQKFTENIMLDLARKLKNSFRLNKLCLAGGVSLNCVVNYVLQKQGPFSDMFVQPAANDAGTALGAALYAWCGVEEQPRKFEWNHSYWGPQYTDDEITTAIKATGLEAVMVDDPVVEAADLIAEGYVVGWFQGKMEAGPRALGNRSLLAHPGRADMRDILNLKVKHREDFRPFAPSVLSEKASEWFEITGRSTANEYMLVTYPVKKRQRDRIPAVVHIDGSSRIQLVRASVNPKYYRLIEKFDQITGIPMVLNTSFNDSEPIVMTPAHALNTFMKTGVDALFLENYLLVKDGVKKNERQ